MQSIDALSDVEMTKDRRAAVRKRVLRGVKLAYADLSFVGDCLIRNLSSGGASLRPVNFDFVPDGFELIFPVDAILRTAHVKWRSGRDIGVEFVGEAVDLREHWDLRYRRFVRDFG
jgi:hypothetical protein